MECENELTMSPQKGRRTISRAQKKLVKTPVRLVKALSMQRCAPLLLATSAG